MVSSSCGTLVASPAQDTVSEVRVSRLASTHTWPCMSLGPSSSLMGTPCSHGSRSALWQHIG